MLINSQYIKSLLSYFSASMIPMILNLLVNPWIALNMSPTDYSITGYYGSFNALLSPLITFYFLQYYIRMYYKMEIDDRKRLKSQVFQSLIMFSLLVSVLCFVCLWIYLTELKSEMSLPAFPYLALSVFAIPLTGIYNLELSEFKMKRDSKSYFCFSTGNGVLLIFVTLLLVVFFHLGAFGKLFSTFIVNLVVFGIIIFRNRSLFSFRFEFQKFKKMFVFCLPLALGAMLGYFFNGFDRTCLESVGNIEEYSNYVIGFQIASYLSVFSSAVSMTFQSDIYESIEKKDKRNLYRVFAIQLSVILFIVLLFIILSPFLVYLLTAGRYTGAVPYAMILAISTFTSTLFYNINCVTISMGFPRIYLYTTIIGCLFMIILIPLFVSIGSFKGVAFVVSFSYLILFLVNCILLKYSVSKKLVKS